MKQFWDKYSLTVGIFSFWLLSLGLTLVCAVNYLDFHSTFPYYDDIVAYGRYLATFAHFDGIHYLRLIKGSYADVGSQAFFPMYPLIINFLSFGFFDPLIIAITTNLTLLMTSIYLVSRDLSKTSLQKFVWLFLSFPTSFFLISNYTESLFIFLTIIFFYLIKRQRFGLASVVALLASATRLVGIFLMITLAIEMLQYKIKYSKVFIYSLLASGGLLSYMYYLYIHYSDPLMFMHVQSMFANGRSNGDIVLLPQVIYRYIKIFWTLEPNSWIYFRAVWEFLLFIVSIIYLYATRHYLRFSYIIFIALSMLLPTLSGSLSSYPRYFLAIIPVYVACIEHLPKRIYWLTTTINYAMLLLVFALHTQGKFVS